MAVISSRSESTSCASDPTRTLLSSSFPRTIRRSFDSVLMTDFCLANERRVSYRTAAYMVAIDRVTRALYLRGMYA